MPYNLFGVDTPTSPAKRGIMTEVTEIGPYWDPYHADQRVAPYEAWRRLSREAPVYDNERFGFWALSRFSDVLAASLDTETLARPGGITLDTIGDPAPFPIDDPVMDFPFHDAYRKVVNRAYTPRRIAALEARISELSRGTSIPSSVKKASTSSRTSGCASR